MSSLQTFRPETARGARLVKAVPTEEILYGGWPYARGGVSKGIALPLVAAIHPKIGFVNRDHHVSGMQLAHTDQTKVG